MSDSSRLLTLLLVASCLVFAGCGDDDDSDDDGGAPEAGVDSGASGDGGDGGGGGSGGDTMDAGPMDGGPEDSGPGDGGDTDSATVLELLCVASAECDGAEDCTGTDVCCADFTWTAEEAGYTSIKCAASCDSYVVPGLSSYPTCHKGETCANPDVSCSVSNLYTQSFGFCVTEATNEPAVDASASAVAGEINCGDDTCTIGVEHCCVWSGGRAKCTAVANECECEPPVADAG